ncbi:MAG: MFS transporter [Chloroflexi bacterium]|nr:MFS transporter [Chloroflexota bacterium]
MSDAAGSGATLRVLGGTDAWPLPEDGIVTVGRDAENLITLVEEGVSRLHAELRIADGGVTIADLGSANGTFIERPSGFERVTQPTPVADGDVIRIGPVRVVYEAGTALSDPAAGQPWGVGLHPPTVAAGFSHFAVGFFVWALPAVLAADIAQEHGMSAIEAKILPATAIMFGAVARLVFGFVTDARGPLRSGSGALVLALIALALLAAFGDSVVVVWVGVALLGVGLASLPIALPLVSRRTAPERRGFALGIMASGSVGIVLAALAGPALADVWDWRTVFGVALIPATIGFAVFLYGARGPWAAPPRGAWRPMARSSDLRVVAFLFGITFGTFAGLYTVLPSVLQASDFDLSSSQAALVVAMGALTGAIARVVGGSIADRVGSHLVLLWVMTATTVLLVLSGNVPLGLAIATFVLSMALFDAGTAAVLKLAAQGFGRTVGAGVGIISAVGGLFGFALALVAGTLFESTESSPATFGVLAVAPAIAGLWLLVVVRRRLAPPAEPVFARLERLDPYGAAVEAVPIGAGLSIGRAPANALWFANDDYVSRSHAQIDLDGERVLLADLDSTNGTMLWRDQQWVSVEREELSDGDVIVIGGNVLRYRAARAG